MPALRALNAVAEVVLVVTQPDRPRGRGQRLQPTPVKAEAQSLGIATSEPQRLRDALGELAAAGADLFALASYGKIVPQAVLDLPRLGALNVHPSLLPLYRGATPLQSVLRDGRKETGVTIMLMDAGMDTGDVVAQERFGIGETETYGDLHDRLAQEGARMLAGAVEGVAAGTAARMPQRDLGVADAEIAATLTRPLTKADYALDWSRPARHLVDQVRSLSPEPGARGTVAGDERPLKVLAAHAADALHAARAGMLASDALGEAGIVCGDGRLLVLDRVVPPDRRAMSGREYLQLLGAAQPGGAR